MGSSSIIIREAMIKWLLEKYKEEVPHLITGKQLASWRRICEIILYSHYMTRNNNYFGNFHYYGLINQSYVRLFSSKNDC